MDSIIENVLEIFVWKIPAILFRLRCVKGTMDYGDLDTSQVPGRVSVKHSGHAW